jgi:hypothetical protein
VGRLVSWSFGDEESPPMAKGAEPAKRYPRDLLGDVAWSFTAPGFRARARFERAVRNYSRRIGREVSWDPAEVVLRCTRVRVRPDFWDDYESEEEEERFIAELSADDPSGFTAGELLHKVHNTFLRRWGQDAGDYTFFEGFHLAKAPAADTAPLYDIALGS